MAKTVNAGKQFKSKPAGAQKVQAGPSGKMKKFGGAPAQTPGQTAQNGMTGKGPEFPAGGPSGKMNTGKKVAAQQPGVSQTTQTSARSSYAK